MTPPRHESISYSAWCSQICVYQVRPTCLNLFFVRFQAVQQEKQVV